jgi:membrane-bound lytic murein transglycosylase D
MRRAVFFLIFTFLLSCVKEGVVQNVPEKKNDVIVSSEEEVQQQEESSGKNESEETSEEENVEKWQIDVSDIIDLIEEEESAEAIDKIISLHPEYDIPMIVNEKVKYFIRYFKTEQRERFKRWLERSSRYVDIMKKILKENNLPQDLVYMALIESGFSTHAYSRARATGPWQFIKSTGKKYGLRVDAWVDERRDPIKSTIAAAKYLKDLYDIFGSWYLAAAGYNAGEKKVLRAMRKGRTKEFWELAETRYLKKETKDYVPKLIAAAIIAKNPEIFGFKDLNYEDPFTYEVIPLHFPIDLSHVERECGIPMDEIKFYNPELKKWFTPPDRKVYELRVPVGASEWCYEKLRAIPEERRLRFKRYIVQKGETISLIAYMFNVKPEEIKALNRIRSNVISPGSEIIVPVHEWEKPRKVVFSKKGKKRFREVNIEGVEHIFYTVQKGDSLWSIAKRFGVSVSDIKKWNNVDKKIFPGDILLIILPKKSERDSTIYTVKKGDTLIKIAKKFKVSVEKLKRVNNLQTHKIYPGLKLKIPESDT